MKKVKMSHFRTVRSRNGKQPAKKWQTDSRQKSKKAKEEKTSRRQQQQ